MATTKMKQAVVMTEGNPMKALIKFSMPLILGNALQQFYNMVDSSVAGNFIGMNALSAVSNGYMIILMVTTVFSGLSVGGTVIIGRLCGKGDEAAIGSAVNAVYFGIAVIVIPVMLVGYFSAEPLLRLFNVPADILPGAVTYVQVIFLGVMGGIGYNVNAGILNGLGDSKTSLKYLAVACAINIALDLLFVIIFDMEIIGTALATVIAQFISWILGVIHINKKYSYIHIGFRFKNIDYYLMKKSLGIGIPSSISSLQYIIGLMMVQSLINSYDGDFIAGVNAGSKLDAFVFMPITSFSSAITTYTAQNIGAGRLDRVGKGVKSGIILTSSVCIALAAIIIPFGRPLMGVMFGLSPDALEAGMAYLYRVMAPSFILGISYVIWGALQGAGAVIVSTCSSITALWIVRIPTANWLAANYGKYNLFCAYVAGWLTGITLSGSYYLSGRWKKKHMNIRTQKKNKK